MKNLRPNYYCSGVFYFSKHPIKFKKNNELISEEDIFNLFNGFVRLIKKSVTLEIEEKYLNKISFLENELDKYKRL